MARVSILVAGKRVASLATDTTAQYVPPAMRPDGKRPNGYVLYRGPSLLDGAPIICVATGFADDSGNSKTGSLIQTFIMREDIPPHEALKSGDDASVCGACAHRPLLARDEDSGKLIDPCYVKVFQSPRSVFAGYHRGIYPQITLAQLRIIMRRRKGRIGAYGDGAAVPIETWDAYTAESEGWTGYSHQWRTCDQRLRRYCMASVDSLAELIEADAMGWRGFRVRQHDYVEVETGNLVQDFLWMHEVPCGASEEMGKVVTCEDCMACGGTGAKAKAHIGIFRHPWRKGEHVTRERARQRLAA